MTRILPLSDLHFEFLKPGLIRDFMHGLPPADIVVLAGDIGVSKYDTRTDKTSSLHTALKAFCVKFPQVVFVPGNHEYYGSSPHEVDLVRRNLTWSLTNLHWLEHETCEVNGIRFVGTTLWFGRPRNPGLDSCLSDFSAIKSFQPWVYEQNAKAVQFLHDTVQPGDVVITHHLPDERGVAPQFKGDALNQFFLCQLPHELLARPHLWFFGHTHKACQFKLDGCQFICNPKGYPGEPPTGFRKDLILEI